MEALVDFSVLLADCGVLLKSSLEVVNIVSDVHFVGRRVRLMTSTPVTMIFCCNLFGFVICWCTAFERLWAMLCTSIVNASCDVLKDVANTFFLSLVSTYGEIES